MTCQDYLAFFRVASPFSTPVQADTTAGLCLCILGNLLGEGVIKELIESFRQGIPFVFSDAFPAGTLPRPLIKEKPWEHYKAKLVDLYGSGEPSTIRNGSLFLKDASRRELVPGEIAWEMLRDECTLEDLLLSGQYCPRNLKPRQSQDVQCQDDFLKCPDLWKDRLNFKGKDSCKIKPLKAKREAPRTRTAIDRATGRVRTGALFEVEETFYAGNLEIYVRIFDFDKDLLHQALRLIQYHGYGKRVSIGEGVLELIDFTPFSFPEAVSPRRLYCLSTFSPSRNDPTEGRYRLFTKHGKVGNQYYPQQVWKKPLIMLRPGAVFETDRPRPYLGRVVSEIHPTWNDPVEIAYALAVGV